MSNWIPVSERLPDEDKWVLACLSDERILIGMLVRAIDDRCSWIVNVRYPLSACIVDDIPHGTCMRLDGVTAWMPCPEPYKPL